MSLRQRNTTGTESQDSLLSNKYDRSSILPTQTGSSASSRQHMFVKTLISVIVMTFAILGIGTIYSNLTSRDPCHVLKEFTHESTLENLPRLFHFQSKTLDITDETNTWMTVLSMSSTIEQYPNIKSDYSSNWTAVYWSDESCKQLVKDHVPGFLPTYMSFLHNIQRVDSCRYIILSVYGGVYADTDVSIHTTNAEEFEYLIPEGVGLVESPYRYNEVWQNSLMTASSPGHVFWNITIEIIMERQGESGVLSSTGPKMIGDAVDRFRQHYLHGSNDTHYVHTLPCELFQRLPLGEWDTTLLNIVGREVLARAIPMQGCGRYGDGRCEITRHNGRASWTRYAGIT